MRNFYTVFCTFTLFLLLFNGCSKLPEVNYKEKAANPTYLHKAVNKLTEVMVHDIFSPPVASRVYAYPSIAAYEVMAQADSSHKSLAEQLNGLTVIPKPEKGKEYCYPLAAVHAFLQVGKAMIFSENDISTFNNELLKEYKSFVPADVYNRSVHYGEQVSQHIIAWANKDNYKETRTYPKYTITDEDYSWKPTPPMYMDPIEPNWNKIRPFVLDSASQFAPVRPTTFSMERDSPFYQEAIEVYETGKKLSKEQQEIAKFWDCNPYVSHVYGHAMVATKKITPGGHWMGITGIAARKVNASFTETAEAYARVSFTLADAFISCWDEKYRSRLIRPETVINQYIDENWAPLLQTPPFPEYPSGHSVVSSAAAIVLTDMFGDNFAFSDSSEVAYGLPVRNFTSFIAASEEAAISRLYGGIHYMPAIKNGVAQGRSLGSFVVSKVKTSTPQLLSAR